LKDIQGGPEKSKPQSFVHIFAKNIDRLSKLFHWRIQWKIWNKAITKLTTTP